MGMIIVIIGRDVVVVRVHFPLQVVMNTYGPYQALARSDAPTSEGNARRVALRRLFRSHSTRLLKPPKLFPQLQP